MGDFFLCRKDPANGRWMVCRAIEPDVPVGVPGSWGHPVRYLTGFGPLEALEKARELNEQFNRPVPSPEPGREPDSVEAALIEDLFARMARQTPRTGCVRRYRKPACRFYVPPSPTDDRCRTACPYPVARKVAKPERVADHGEIPGLFEGLDWEG
jgi:hypothetical protein